MIWRERRKTTLLSRWMRRTRELTRERPRKLLSQKTTERTYVIITANCSSVQIWVVLRVSYCSDFAASRTGPTDGALFRSQGIMGGEGKEDSRGAGRLLACPQH